MIKGKALRRALTTADAYRVSSEVPLIVDTTELITPEIAQTMLNKNTKNRPVNWRQVEEYAAIMAAGQWRLHAQGIVIGSDGNLLTGQTRLWAVIYSNVSVYMRVSRGNPPDVGRWLDRGRSQSSRDLASRETDRTHSPIEASMARAMCVLRGTIRPSRDELGHVIAANRDRASAVLAQTVGTKKTKGVVMILAAICAQDQTPEACGVLVLHLDQYVANLSRALLPTTPEQCWGRGAAFQLAMGKAAQIVTERRE